MMGVVGDEVLAPAFLTPLTATFVHAGIIHLGFNLLILLFFVRSVETIIGGKQLAILSIVGSYAASAVQYAVDPTDQTPLVGASGETSALRGAYSLMFWCHSVQLANQTHTS